MEVVVILRDIGISLLQTISPNQNVISTTALVGPGATQYQMDRNEKKFVVKRDQQNSVQQNKLMGRKLRSEMLDMSLKWSRRGAEPTSLGHYG